MSENKTANPSVKDLMMEWEKEQKKSKSTKRKDTSADVEKTKQSKPTEKRARAFALVTYIDTQYLDKFLKRAPWVRNWAYCTHDRDVNSDNTPKEKHTHVILYTYEAKTSSAVKKLFDRYSQEVYANSGTEPQNTTSQICHDVVSQYRYLLHQDDKGKYQYEPACRITDSTPYWYELELKAGLTAFDSNPALAVIDDIMSGVSAREMASRYGRDYIINCDRYRKFAQRVEFEQLCPYENVDAMLFLLLQGSDIPQEKIDTFYEVFSRLKSMSILEYGSRVVLRLAENH